MDLRKLQGNNLINRKKTRTQDYLPDIDIKNGVIIADGKYNGNTSVNYINGEVKICPFGCSVEFEDGACTRMAADPYSMEMEHSFLEALDDVEKFTLEGDVVLLKDEHDIVLMKLARK